MKMGKMMICNLKPTIFKQFIYCKWIVKASRILGIPGLASFLACSFECRIEVNHIFLNMTWQFVHLDKV